MKSNYGWKFLQYINGKIVSDFDKSEWIVGVERKLLPPTELCKGLNCCKTIEQARSFVNGNVLAKVKYSGKKIISADKITCEKMTIIKAWHFMAQARADFEKVTAQAWAEYNKVTAPASAEYDKVTAPAWAEYNKVAAQAWDECDKVRAQARAEYDKITAQARAEFNKVTASASAEYDKVTAPAWADFEKVEAQAWKKIIKTLEEIK